MTILTAVRHLEGEERGDSICGVGCRYTKRSGNSIFLCLEAVDSNARRASNAYEFSSIARVVSNFHCFMCFIDDCVDFLWERVVNGITLSTFHFHLLISDSQQVVTDELG